MQLKCKNEICVVYGECTMTHQTCQSGLRSFILEISSWMIIHGPID